MVAVHKRAIVTHKSFFMGVAVLFYLIKLNGYEF
jgi:hypothetical protein